MDCYYLVLGAVGQVIRRLEVLLILVLILTSTDAATYYRTATVLTSSERHGFL